MTTFADIERTPADQIEIAARASAANILDPEQRKALAAQLENAIALVVGLHGGLHLAAPDGLRVDRAVDAHAHLAEASLRDLLGAVQSGDVFYTNAEHRAIDDERAAFYADLERDPEYVIRRSTLDTLVDGRRERVPA